MKPLYRMLATDLDGTLFGPGTTVSKRNREAILKATRKGVRIILCSGRAPKEGITALGKDLGLDYPGNYYICCSGALTVDAVTGETVEGNYLPKPAAQTILEAEKRLRGQLGKPSIRMHTTRAVYVNKLDEKVAAYETRFGKELRLLPDNAEAVEGEITKLLFLSWETEDYSRRCYEALAPFVPREAFGYMMPPALSEYVGASAQKGRAVLSLAARLGIKKEEVICMGDGFNDVSMLEAAGLGIAVKNAAGPALEAAKLIYPYTNEEDAVGRAIEEFCL